MSDIPSPRDLLVNPQYYLNSVDLSTRQCQFLKLSDDAYRRSSFMDHRLRSQTGEPMQVPLAMLESMIRENQASNRLSPVHYIFHTAFCCSTLISRCLDIEGVSRAVREPAVLMQMANYKRAGDPYSNEGNRWHGLLSTVLFLLAKPRTDGEIVCIKPTNATNNLAGEIIRQPRTGGVLLLYSKLDQFLVSILKKGEEGRAFVRRLFNVIRRDSERARSLSVESLAQLTDMQMAAFVWYLQMDAYLRLLTEFPNAAIRTLDCDTFLAAPLTTLAKLCHLFEIRVEQGALEAIVAGPGFTRYSKDESRGYDSSARTSENEQIVREHRETLDGILAWSGGLRPEGPIRVPLTRAL